MAAAAVLVAVPAFGQTPMDDPLDARDAKRLGVREGDLVEVASRRGTVRAPARVGGIEPGHVFIPFHYGYWDQGGDEHRRAANELTVTAWDPVSKQPYFKFAAVSVQRVARRRLMARVADVATHVADGVGELADAYLSTTHLGTWTKYRSRESYLSLVDATWENRAFGDFWQHCLVAEGAIDVAAEPIVSTWDVAAVQVLVEQAGGRFTDLEGMARFDGGTALSSNGLLHDAALAMLRR